MNPDELLKLLDLHGKPPRLSDHSAAVAPGVTPAEAAEAKSPTALAVDEWGLRRGRDLIAESDRLKQAGTDEFAAADFFLAAFEPDPRLLPACREPRRHEFLAQLLGRVDSMSWG